MITWETENLEYPFVRTFSTHDYHQQCGKLWSMSVPSSCAPIQEIPCMLFRVIIQHIAVNKNI